MKTKNIFAKSSNQNNSFLKELNYLIIVLLLSFGLKAQAQWVAINSGIPAPDGAWTLATNGTTLYAGIIDSINGGIFTSTNMGSSWTSISNGLPGLAVRSIAVSGSNLYAAVDSYGLFLSTNNGNSWTPINSGLSSGVLTIMIKGTDIYVGTGNGIFKSTTTTGIYNWTSISSGLNGLEVSAISFNNNDIFVVCLDGVYQSINNGNSWTQVNNGITYPNEVHSTILNHNSYIYIGAGLNTVLGSTPGVFSSNNTGTISWTNSSTGMYGDEIVSFHSIGNTIFAGSTGSWGGLYADFFYSNNNGATWNLWKTGLGSGHVYSIVSIGSTVFAAVNGFGCGFYKRNANELGVGFEEIKNENMSLGIYPNPFGNITTISYELKQNAAIEVSVKDILGKTIAVIETKNQINGNHSLTWNAGGINPGMYLIQLKADDQIISKKVTITK